ncbi:hypothetical protein L484_001789 [Morus notabilis]|uniref:Uncharacterized protein n=1 Tax=Morus notabilis TaxID=981085 RepID=W9RLI3_9ROSA|nr:hypothetical protein L484_001789 [Morus notabilis]
MDLLKNFCSSLQATSSVGDAHRRRSSLESLFCYDKAVPEERIEKPVGIYLAEKLIGDNPRCNDCHAKGAVLCSTCSGSGLYVDSILESQGTIVKVRCLGVAGNKGELVGAHWYSRKRKYRRMKDREGFSRNPTTS